MYICFPQFFDVDVSFVIFEPQAGGNGGGRGLKGFLEAVAPSSPEDLKGRVLSPDLA